MTYSFQEMKALCLYLAERADTYEAQGLRDLASNYDVAADDSHIKRKIPERWVRVVVVLSWGTVISAAAAAAFVYFTQPTPRYPQTTKFYYNGNLNAVLVEFGS